MTILVVASLAVIPLSDQAKASTAATDATAMTAAVTSTTASSTVSALPSVTLDTTFTPLPRGGKSPWDGEFLLDGIDGLTYNSPGTEVKVRAMSSNAFFVDEVWLVYPRVQYLFNNKDVPDLGNQFDAIQFSDWIIVGTFPPGTELIFGVKTGVGIDDKCQDRTNADGSVDRHHCYKVEQNPDWVPLAPDPKRVCAITDDPCRNKAWPSTTPDGRTIFYTGPGVRNVKDDSPHGRFQYLTNTKKDGTGTPLTNTALFGLEDVGAPLQKDGTACPTAKELATLVTTTPVVNLLPELTGDLRTAAGAITQTQTVGLSTVSGLGVGKRIQIHQPFQRETVTITAIDTVAKTITAVFINPDNKPYPAGTSWAPEGCDWHPDFQDAGIVVWPALAATCQATTVKDRVAIVGQEGYGTVSIRDSTLPTPFTQQFAPGELIDFTVNTLLPPGVTLLPAGSAAKWAVNVHGQALMSITDITKPVDDANRTLDAGICYDPQFPPPPIINAIVGSATCGSDWDFTITNVTAATAPPSIRVTFTNDQTPPADEAATIPLSEVDANGTAHYRSGLFTSLRAVSATTTSPTTTWQGTFSLVAGPCPVTHTLTACPVAGMTEWDIMVTGTTQSQAPAKVSVLWEGQTTPTDLPLSGAVVGGIAHYRTALNAALRIVSATMAIQGAWSGAFTTNGGPCPGAKQLTLSTLPPCASAATSWSFTISNMTETLAPASILVTWSGLAAEAVSRTSVVNGVAHYTTTAHTGASYAPFVSATADLTFATPGEADAFTGQFTAAPDGVPCPPPPPTTNVGACEPIYNPATKQIPTAGENPSSGQNPDGFYRLRSVTGGSVVVHDTQSTFKTPAWPHLTTIKLTEANGATPTYWAGPLGIDYQLRLQGDAEVWIYTNATGSGEPVNKVRCYVPNHPKSTPTPTPTATPTPTPPVPTVTPTPTATPRVTASCSGDLDGVWQTPPALGLPASGPRIHVPLLHISCSDLFPNGYSDGNSDLAGHRIAEWWIIREQSGGSKCISFYFRYTDGHVDAGTFGGGMNVTSGHDLTRACTLTSTTSGSGSTSGGSSNVAPVVTTPPPSVAPSPASNGGLKVSRSGNVVTVCFPVIGCKTVTLGK